MRARLKRMVVLCLLCVAGAFATSAPAANAACISFDGSGSSLQSHAQTNDFIPGWKELLSPLCGEKINVTYTATSSGTGEAEWGAETGALEPEKEGVAGTFDAYIGTDVAPEGAATKAGSQLANIALAGKSSTGSKNQVTAVPVAQSAVEIVVSLPASGCEPTKATSHGQLLNGNLQQEWFEGNVSFFSLVNNIGIPSSCTTTPTLLARAKASGTTAGFKRYLNILNSTNWGTFTATAAKSQNTEWPAAAHVQTTSNTGGELALNVFKTPGSVGYVDQADAIAAGFSTTLTKHGSGSTKFYSFAVELQNNGVTATKAATYKTPEGSEGSSNCEGVTYNAPATVAPDIDWSGATENNATKGSVYPICTLTFDLGWEHYKYIKEYASPEETVNGVLGFLQYVVKTGQNTKLLNEHYAKLPAGIATEAVNGAVSSNIGV